MHRIFSSQWVFMLSKQRRTITKPAESRRKQRRARARALWATALACVVSVLYGNHHHGCSQQNLHYRYRKYVLYPPRSLLSSSKSTRFTWHPFRLLDFCNSFFFLSPPTDMSPTTLFLLFFQSHFRLAAYFLGWALNNAINSPCIEFVCSQGFFV